MYPKEFVSQMSRILPEDFPKSIALSHWYTRTCSETALTNTSIDMTILDMNITLIISLPFHRKRDKDDLFNFVDGQAGFYKDGVQFFKKRKK